MVSGQETIFCWVPVPELTMVVTSIAFFSTLPTNNPHKHMLLVSTHPHTMKEEW
jgi:hypothetical protein